jgi:hypothetical protein
MCSIGIPSSDSGTVSVSSAGLIPLFLLFLVFGSMRALLWHGPMGWRHQMHHGHWGWRDENGKDVPPFFEEWHRRAHGEPQDESAKK